MNGKAVTRQSHFVARQPTSRAVSGRDGAAGTGVRAEIGDFPKPKRLGLAPCELCLRRFQRRG
jgi:hypothetical protein